MGQTRDRKSRELHFFSLEKNENRKLGTGFIVHRRIVPAVKTT